MTILFIIFLLYFFATTTRGQNICDDYSNLVVGDDSLPVGDYDQPVGDYNLLLVDYDLSLVDYRLSYDIDVINVSRPI